MARITEIKRVPAPGTSENLEPSDPGSWHAPSKPWVATVKGR
jgi:hypothetical protein